LFLQAIKTLADLENGDEKFELLNAVHGYSAEPYLAARFADDVGRDIGNEERHAIDYYVAAVVLVDHHRGSLGGLAEVLDDFAGQALDFIRSAAWAFLTAWTQRYGGYNSDLVVRGAFIDPSRRNPV
jgi:hypothetical protein